MGKPRSSRRVTPLPYRVARGLIVAPAKAENRETENRRKGRRDTGWREVAERIAEGKRLEAIAALVSLLGFRRRNRGLGLRRGCFSRIRFQNIQSSFIALLVCHDSRSAISVAHRDPFIDTVSL